MIDVDALIAFAAVIDTGSFSAAAERLGQTPSGVSRTISRLEAQLGMTLMHRTTSLRRWWPTSSMNIRW